MAITVARSPTNGLTIAKEGLRRLMRVHSRTLADLMQADIPNLTVAAPHGGYLLDFEDLNKSISSRARLVCWRYPVFDGEHPRLAADVEVNDDWEATDFLGTNFGRLVETFVDAVAFAEKEPAIEDGDFELRFLEVPSVYFTAVWLHSDDDYFVPIPEAVGGTPLLLTEQELLTHLAERFESRLKNNEDVL